MSDGLDPTKVKREEISSNIEEFDPFSESCHRVDENLDISLAAPPENKWYHGRLSRPEAEDRLRLTEKFGSYLIRESDRKNGSYVLSFYGQTGINHFRITAMCGDYYIGGRQFESMSDLIGYYTHFSDLLKGERLQFPVQPPEPVDDKRRVMAVLPYNKMVDTDELSFDTGDVFVVHNDLGDGWLWVTSTKETKESGIVYHSLVEDLGGSDPIESKEWFHASITKEDAARKLGEAGESSFLVRPSENSPGDYSLYFHCSNQIQRFRIQKKGRQFIMGGRYFDSMSAIIERYKREQILEGYCLGHPVLRARGLIDSLHGVGRDVISGIDRGRNIYEQMRQSSGSNFLSQRNDSQIVMKGYLHKKSEKTKKWKSYYFVLSGTEEHLYFFENIKRSKPKGLIDLNYSSIYPVHDGLFGRPNCFQLVVRALNHLSFHYLCADSPDQSQAWTRALKSYCINTKPKKGNQNTSLKELYNLNITILDANHINQKHCQHPYCIFSLNDVKMSRTQVAEGSQPVWEEEFILDDISTDIETFTISVYNKGRRTDVETAFVRINLSALTQGETIDDRYNLIPTPALNIKPDTDMGSIRIKCRFLHEVIMPVKEYSSLKELVLAKDFATVLALSQVCGNDRVPLAKSLLNIFRDCHQEAALLKTLNDSEIEKEEEVGTLFRATSLSTTLMDQYMKMTATKFIQCAIKPSINKIMESRQSCELNPALLDSCTVDTTTNSDALLHTLDEVTSTIFTSADYCPAVLRFICGCLQRSVSSKWPDNDHVKTRVVSGFIFLRLLCPALVNPKSFNLISETPSDIAARNMKLVAKALQSIANLTPVKEDYMEKINPFVMQNKQKMIAFLDELSNITNLPCQDSEDMVPTDSARELGSIHYICASHLVDLKALASRQPCLKKLVAVVDMLTIHKKHYKGLVC